MVGRRDEVQPPAYPSKTVQRFVGAQCLSEPYESADRRPASATTRLGYCAFVSCSSQLSTSVSPFRNGSTVRTSSGAKKMS